MLIKNSESKFEMKYNWEGIMVYMMITLFNIVNKIKDVEETTSMVQQTTSSSTTDIIGIGGIAVTLIVGIITCIVTWKLTMKSIKQKKLAYNIQVFPILSKSVANGEELQLEELKITYKNKELQNPCLLNVEIINTGNEAINNPPITIKSYEDIKILPGYLDDVPPGYKSLWRLEQDETSSCSIKIEHINPKQVVKARFVLDNLPNKKIEFECPMQNVQVFETSHNNIIPSNIASRYSKSNLVLIVLTILLFVSVDYWAHFAYQFFQMFDLRIPIEGLVAFTFSFLIITVLMNVYGLSKIDIYMITHPKQANYIKLAMVLICFILLPLIVFDIIITGVKAQLIAGTICIILLAMLVHFFTTSKIK